MALKGQWTNRVNGVNYVMADDVNSIAQALIELEEKFEALPTELPNPYALVFGGEVSATYDGSEAVQVNIPSGGSGTSTGDMLKSTYDADGDGVVDNAESLGGVVASNYATKTVVSQMIEDAVGIALEGSY